MLKKGDVIRLEKGMKVYAHIPAAMVYTNSKSIKLCRRDVEISDKFNWLTGDYIVYKTAIDGGGSGHGEHDVFPKGHHVYCVSVEDESLMVDFYQSGEFTAMIKDIKPIGRAKQKWVCDLYHNS